jgi:hypothetical protein
MTLETVGFGLAVPWRLSERLIPSPHLRDATTVRPARHAFMQGCGTRSAFSRPHFILATALHPLSLYENSKHDGI